MNLGFHFDLIPFQSYSNVVLFYFHFGLIPFQCHSILVLHMYSILVIFHFSLIPFLSYSVVLILFCSHPFKMSQKRTYIRNLDFKQPKLQMCEQQSMSTQLLDPSIKDINDHSRSNSYYLVPNIMHKKDLSLGYVYYIFVFRSNL